jgi:competence protein ComEA
MRPVLLSLFFLALLALAAPAAAAAQAPAPAPSAAKAHTIDLNSATLADLESLPGIGRSTAQRILDHRQKIGGFKKIEELMNVKGIGEKSFLKLKPLVSVTLKPEKAGAGR